MVSGFVKNYKIWKYHGEMDTSPLTNNPLDKIIQDEEFDRMFHSYFLMVVGMMMVMMMMMMMMMMGLLMMMGLVGVIAIIWLGQKVGRE
jgi:hypothetical protein